MRSRVAWLLAGFGLAAAIAARLRARPAPRVHDEPARDPRADELRERIAESRELLTEREEFEAAETPVDQAADPEARRREIHQRGRAAVDRMRGDGGG
jgi:hypothetical protein